MTSFGEWLESGTIKRREVPLYADAAIMDEMVALDARIQQVEAQEKRDRENGDRTFADKSMLEELQAEAEALWERYEASKSVWHVRATTPAERDEAFEMFPEEDAPVLPRGSVSEAAKRAWEKARDEWKVRALKSNNERKLLLLSKAVEKVEIGGNTITSVSVDDLRAMRGGAYGTERIDMLWRAVDEASKQGEAPVPFSHRASETTPD